MANQKQIKTGIPIVPDNVDIDGNVDNLPRQNAERDNAVVGAQGQSKSTLKLALKKILYIIIYVKLGNRTLDLGVT